MKPEINNILREYYGTAKKGAADEILELLKGFDKDVIYPFTSDEFINAWRDWKEYKLLEHGFKYKSKVSQQASLRQLSNMAKGNEQLAIDIIYYTISKTWHGFQLPKNNETTKSKYDTFRTQA